MIMESRKPIVLWIHGFTGKPNNENVCEMRRRFTEYDWYSIEVDHHAIASMEKINDYIKNNNVAIVAGTSLGGFYAMCADFSGPKFVVNPVTDPLRDLKQFIGPNTYKPGRPDGQTDFIFTEEMLNEFSQIQPGNLDKTLCTHTMHDSLLGEDIKSDYKQLFTHRKEIDPKILPDHFITFAYVKKELPSVLEYLKEHFNN